MNGTRHLQPSIEAFRPQLSGHVYSNFDHELDEDTVRLLEAEKHFAIHSAWDFEAKVFRLEGKWYSEVWKLHEVVAILEGDSVKAVINEANERFGGG